LRFVIIIALQKYLHFISNFSHLYQLNDGVIKTALQQKRM